MNNEIKEILDSLKFVIDNPTLEDEVGDEQVTIINYTELNAEESKQLLDRITNLQEENSEQLDENLKLSEWLVKKQKRIEKAIEYIKEHQRKDELLNLNEWQTRDLLNILNGGDE